MPLKPNTQRTSQAVRQHESLAPPTLLSALAEELTWQGNRGDLVPQSIYVAGDFDQAADALGATARHVVGSGTSEAGTVRRMLRHCAPLAQEGWHMLCEYLDGDLRYGVIARGSDRGPDLRPSDARYPAEQEVRGIEGVRIWEPYKGILAVSVVSDDVLHSEPGGAMMPEPSPLARLVAAAAEHGSEDAQAHLTRLFDHALSKATGALVAVVPQSWSGGRPCEDAIVLRAPIDLPRLAAEAGPDGRSRVAVAQYEALAASMIRDDGIVVFDAAARLRAYRWFVPFSPRGEQLSGGARERAFRALEYLVSESVLRAAFIQSRDGTRSFASSETVSSAPFLANVVG